MERSEVYKKIEDHYRRHSEKLIKSYAGRMGNHHVAEEVVQEGYTRACEYWDPAGGIDNFDAWINQIISNAATKAMKVERHRGATPITTVSIDSVPEAELIDPAPLPDTTVLVNEILRDMSDSPRRELLKRVLIEEWTEEEVGEYFGISQQAVSKAVTKFTTSMREKYAT
jgi:RNA polymerase sigma factor (sigma-70 family)